MFAIKQFPCSFTRGIITFTQYGQGTQNHVQSDTGADIYECEGCDGCPYKKSCTRAKGNRKLYLSKEFLRQREESLLRITSEKGVLLRMNRSIQVEGAFGVRFFKHLTFLRAESNHILAKILKVQHFSFCCTLFVNLIFCPLFPPVVCPS